MIFASGTRRFLQDVAGTDDHFRVDEFAAAMRSRIVSAFSDALGAAKVPVLDLAARYQEFGQALLPAINPALVDKYGVEVTSFVIENVSVPPELEQAIDKAASIAAIGNLDEYVKYQLAQGLETGNAGTAGVGAEMAVGMSIAQKMLAPAAPQLLTVAEVAKALTVSEADVEASLEAGVLKGKKIGSQWRVTRAALDEFLAT